MLLVIDIGNTNINIGIFDKEVLVESVKYDSDKRKPLVMMFLGLIQ